MIDIPIKIINQIRTDGAGRYPDECCGIMFGKMRSESDKTVESIWMIDNTSSDDERFHRFLIDADTMLAAEKKAALDGTDIVGFYHSHPDHPAVPSQYDLDHALPVYSYLIVSVWQGIPSAFRSWYLYRKKERWMFQEEEIRGCLRSQQRVL